MVAYLTSLLQGVEMGGGMSAHEMEQAARRRSKTIDDGLEAERLRQARTVSVLMLGKLLFLLCCHVGYVVLLMFLFWVSCYVLMLLNFVVLATLPCWVSCSCYVLKLAKLLLNFHVG